MKVMVHLIFTNHNSIYCQVMTKYINAEELFINARYVIAVGACLQIMHICQISCYCLKDLESNPTLGKEWSFQRKNYFFFIIIMQAIINPNWTSNQSHLFRSFIRVHGLMCKLAVHHHVRTYYASILVHVVLGSFSFKSQEANSVIRRTLLCS